MVEKDLMLTGYDVILKRLTEEKLEMVRQWRNDPKISKHMFFQDYITPEMQQKWFQTINNDENLYLIIKYKNEDIGLINLKDIDYSKKVGEFGIFIYEDKYLATDISYRAHLLFLDYIFEELNIEEVFAHVRKENSQSERMAFYLGYVANDNNDSNLDKLEYILHKENYLNNKNRLKFIKKYNILKNK